MSVTEMWIVLGCAAIGAVLIVSAVIRGSRNLDEGMNRLRLGLNFVLLILRRAVWAIALALFAIGWYRGNTDYWYYAFFVLLMGMLLLRDLGARSATRSEPSWDNEDDEARPFIEFHQTADVKTSSEDRTDEGERTTRTWSFTFEWPPRRPKR